MRGADRECLTIGERVAWYRRRRGMSQEALAGLVGRTSDWLGKAENNRIALDRLSVLCGLASALEIRLGVLIGEPTSPGRSAHRGGRAVSALREALMDYRQLTPLLGAPVLDDAEPASLPELGNELRSVFDAYQASQLGFAAARSPMLLADVLHAARCSRGDQRIRAYELLALSYHAIASVLTKLGEPDLAWMAAERGLSAAQETGNAAVTGSLFRAVSFALLATGRLGPAMRLTEAGAAFLQPYLGDEDPELQSVYGMLFLAGSMAAARAKDRDTTRGYLNEAHDMARRLGADRNHLWTAFGPTNVAIHRVNTVMELGDTQVALKIGPPIDTTALPAERRARHLLELARAYNAAGGRTDEALASVLDAEQVAPELVRHHYMGARLVVDWMRNTQGRPSFELVQLASRMRMTG